MLHLSSTKSSGFHSSDPVILDVTLSFSGLVKTDIVKLPLPFSQLTCTLFQEASGWCFKSAGLEACLSNSTTIAAGSFPLRFNTCHLSVSKLQRSKFPKTDLLCVLSVSGAAVHRDGPNPIFSLGFCSIKIATSTLHEDKQETYSLDL